MALPTKKVVQGSHLLQHALRSFKDGLTVLGNDVSMPSSASSMLDNFYVAQDGSLQLRFGTKQYIDLSAIEFATTFLFEILSIVRTGGSTATWSAGDTLTVGLQLAVDLSVDAALEIVGKTLTVSGYAEALPTGVSLSQINAVHTAVGASYTPGAIFIHITATASNVSGSAWTHSMSTPASVSYTATAGADVVNIASLQSSLIAVLANGYVVQIDSTGNGYGIWSPAIAAAQGNASPWTTCSFCSFAIFNSVLLICDGVNKPLRVDLASTYKCDYIKDPVDNSNTAVPTCRYVTVINDFVFMAGDAEFVDRVYTSSQGTYTVWRRYDSGTGLDIAAAEPNNGNYIDVGKYVVAADSYIKGIGRYRDKLLVTFVDATLLGDVGNLVAQGTTPETYKHVPSFSDSIPGTGTISHRSMMAFGNDFYLVDTIGVPSIQRALFTGTLIPQRISQQIDYELRSKLNALSIATQEDHIFAVQNRREQQYLLFVPDDNALTTYTVYVYTLNESASIKAWSRYTGLTMQCGCTDITGRMYFCAGKKVYQYGTIEDAYYADTIVYVDDVVDSATPISFVYESPWIDFNAPMLTKALRYLQCAAYGTAHYTVDLFVDHKYYGEDGVVTPYASLQFVGGDTGAYGNADQPYGAGRNAFDPQLFAMYASGKTFKIRIRGDSALANESGHNLRIIAMYFAYLRGSIR